MKLSYIEFEAPVMNPADPKGMYRARFHDPSYTIESERGVTTITAPDGRQTVTSFRFHGTPHSASATPDAEDTSVGTPKAKAVAAVRATAPLKR